MGKKRRKGLTAADSPRPAKLHGVEIEDEAAAAATFLAAMAAMDGKAVPQKLADRPDAEAARVAGSVGSPRPSGPPGTRSSAASPIRLDLHYKSLDDAQAHVETLFDSLLMDLRQPVTVMVITGKGRHSGPRGGVLAREIHEFIRRRYGRFIARIEESPADVVVGQLPIRGHFHVTLSRRS